MRPPEDLTEAPHERQPAHLLNQHHVQQAIGDVCAGRDAHPGAVGLGVGDGDDERPALPLVRPDLDPRLEGLELEELLQNCDEVCGPPCSEPGAPVDALGDHGVESHAHDVQRPCLAAIDVQ